MLKTLIGTAGQAAKELENRISSIRYGGFENSKKGLVEVIYFMFDGQNYKGRLTGRNKNLLLGFGEEKDKAIAARVFLDGEFEIIK